MEIYRLADSITPLNVQARYNVAPTQDVPAARLRPGSDEREIAMLPWGLIPSWAKDMSIGAKMINARAETVHEKPSFRSAFKQRRCLVVADGFYEWQKQPHGPKQPYFITVADFWSASAEWVYTSCSANLLASVTPVRVGLTDPAVGKID